MFKFGKNARLNGPYDKYREPVTSVQSSVRQKARVKGASQITQANCGPGGMGVGGFGDPGAAGGFSGMAFQNTGGMSGSGADPGFPQGGSGGGGYNTDRYNPVYDFLEEGTLLESWIPRDAAGLDMLFRRMYLRDPTLGPGIDIIRSLPWSDFTLDGVDDPAIRKIYEDCMSYMHPQLLMPDITGDFLVVGKNSASLIFDSYKGVFSGIIPHDPDFLRITPLPLYGHDPLIDLKLSPGFRRILTSNDPRVLEVRKALPPQFLEVAMKEQGFLPLDPVSTIYLARRASPNDSIGTSLLTRCLYFWAIEKALLNAQMASTRRRSRPFIHLMAGIDNVWEPTAEDLDALAGMLMQVNEDPVGGVVATRTGVTISEPVGGGADFYKWSDELELFAKYKMQAIGISDALISGDSTYNNAENARSVFVENLSGLRARITQGVFYQKMFPTIARLHGFVKRTKAELDHGIRTSQSSVSRHPIWAKTNQVTSARLSQRRAAQIPTSELIMPTINWSKQLRPDQDEQALDILEKLQQNEFPVTLKQWANAAGISSKNLEADIKEDKKLRDTLAGMDQEASASENADQVGEDVGDTEEIDEAPGTDDAVDDLLDQLEKEATSSSYAKAKKIVTGSVKRVSDLPIWVGNRCGKLGRTEAINTLRSILSQHREALKDPKALTECLKSKLQNEEKVEIMAYCMNRMGYSALPISSRSAQIISSACQKRLTRHQNFKTEKALLDLKRYAQEVKFLGASVQNKNYREDLENSLKNFKQTLGNKIYSGV